MELKTVYLVEDDNDVGVYSTPELAEEAKRRTGNGYSIGTVQIDAMPDLIDGCYAWAVRLNKPSLSKWKVIEVDYVNIGKFSNDRKPQHWTRDTEMVVICLAKTREEAVEIALQLAGEA